MLLDHTSDLNDFFFNPKIDHAAAVQPGRDVDREAHLALRAAGPIRPGKVWAYSNTNYLLLGELVRSGRPDSPLAKEIRARLLDPLEPRARVVPGGREAADGAQRRLPARAGTDRWCASPCPVAPPSDVMPFRSVVTAAGGAGSIAATAEDTARWMQAFAGGRVLSPAMQTAMLGDVAYTRALHARIPYGLGIQQVSIAGQPALGHSGRYLGLPQRRRATCRRRA